MARGRFEGQRVAVIGGTAGMGAAIAARAHAEGARVVLTSRDQGRARDVAGSLGGCVEGFALDTTDTAAIPSFFGALGEIDHLVVTAATMRRAAFRQDAVEDARVSFDGKFWSQYLCARHAQVRGSILLFSGVLSRRPQPGAVVATAVNAAVEGLGRALAVELAPVRVNIMSPGLVQGTAGFAAMTEEARAAMIAGAAAKLPAGLVGNADSIAAVALGLLESDYVTGTVVDVDGGHLLA